MKRISILGSTGSIGVNTLNVIRENPDRYQVVALAAGRNIDLLREQMEEFKPELVAVEDEENAGKLRDLLHSCSGVEIVCGMEGYCRVAEVKNTEVVVSAIAGAAGLLPTLAAIEAGRNIALANKEAMVMAGTILMKRAQAREVTIMPVDSEHSAIYQCIQGHRREDIKRIILTASGGPFLNLPVSELSRVTPAQALQHPKWNMGKKITIDSATLMNKGLEIIEARWLFDVDFENIHVHIHPQSIVHSMVEYVDGSILAQLGMPDMKAPIAYALSFPERTASTGALLDLYTAGPLEFFAPDFARFPNMKLAYEAGIKGGTMPAVLNAANETAVKAFLEGRIKFTHITDIIEKGLSLHHSKDAPEIKDIFAADRWAREVAEETIGRLM
jgi:1-deoxy-D-xylulose-5-phosphate reductoisomerase